MKKLLLSLVVSAFTAHAFSQVVCDIKSPAAIAGIINVGLPNGWGPDMTNPANAVLDTVQIIDDGTAADSLGCNPAASLTGKIAVIYRGVCNISTKVKNAQLAGAVGAIVINAISATNSDSSAVFSPGGGTDGPSVTIPVVMISARDGLRIRKQLDAGQKVVAYIGVPANQLGIKTNKSVRPTFGSMPLHLAKTGANMPISLGTWIFNRDQVDVSNITVNAKVVMGTTEVYNQNVPVSGLPKGDSVFVSFPNFAPATYQIGRYDLTYTVSSATADPYTVDNAYVTRFDISDSLYSMAQLSDNNKIMQLTTSTTPTPPANAIKLCIHFKDANAGRTLAKGVYFRGLVTNAPKVLTGVEIEAGIYDWDDEFTNADDATTNSINLIDLATYTYTSNAQDSAIYFKFDAPIELESNERYLVCINKPSADTVFFPFDGNAQYTTNADTLKTLSVLFNNGTQYFTGFVGSGSIAPAIALNTGVNYVGLKEESAAEALAYPNPANESINVLVNGAGKASLTITDLSGRLVAKDAVKIEGGSFKANTSNLNAGTYIFNVDFENGTNSQFKVVIAK